MKKLQFFLMIGALSMLMASCMKEDDEQKTLKSYSTFKVNPPAFTTDSKAFLHFTQTLSRILYQEGDIIYINGVPFALSKSGQGESTVWYANRADGSHDDISDYTFYCCYADGSVTNFDSPNYTVSMGSNYASTTGIVLAGNTESNVVTLTPCFAALVFETSDASYTSMKVGFSKDVIPLEFDVSASNTQITSAIGYLGRPAEGSTQYLMSMHDTTIDSRRYFWVAVPIVGNSASTYLYISYTKNGTTTYRRTKTMVTLEPGKVYKLPSEDMSQYAFNSDGVGNGVFSVGNEKMVKFSAGNLQYYPSNANQNRGWRFAEYQYDLVPEGQNNAAFQTNEFYLDLFGWATSGYNNTAKYMPYYTNATASNYGPGEYDLTGTYNYCDWGVYNSTTTSPRSIKYGNEVSHASWRTLSKDEWNYLLNTRCGGNASNFRGRATITKNDKSYKGLVLLPDGWDFNRTDLSFSSTGTNTYSIEDWDKMEKAGAIFLPAAGYRKKQSGANSTLNTENGYYWTVSHNSNNNNYESYVLFFNEQFITATSSTLSSISRSYGCSVRLVTDVNVQ